MLKVLFDYYLPGSYCKKWLSFIYRVKARYGRQ